VVWGGPARIGWAGGRDAPAPLTVIPRRVRRNFRGMISFNSYEMGNDNKGGAE
jgi:hypothetical protein